MNTKANLTCNITICDVTSQHIREVEIQQSLGLPQTLRFSLLIFLSLLLFIGVVGNVLTLLALPYVRRKYGSLFTILQSSTVVLFLHLSFCDLLYISVGFTHFIHVLIVDGDPFLVLGSLHAEKLCYTVALVRNWAAEADFATMGAIALCVCRHKMCAECRQTGNPSYHSQHNDLVFGNRGIYFVILFIWIWSFAAISCDVFGITGVYKWTNTMYGCDVTYTDHTSYGMVVNILGNLLVILVAYSIVTRRLVVDQREAITTMNNPIHNMFTKHIKMLIFLSIAYTVCILPASILGWGMFNLDHLMTPDVQLVLQAITSCLYWCMYGLNFVLYLITSERLRAAYWTFLKDIFRQLKVEEVFETRDWWSGLRHPSMSGGRQNTQNLSLSGGGQNTQNLSLSGGGQNTQNLSMSGGRKNTLNLSMSGGRQNTQNLSMSGGGQNTQNLSMSGGRQNTLNLSMAESGQNTQNMSMYGGGQNTPNLSVSVCRQNTLNLSMSGGRQNTQNISSIKIDLATGTITYIM